MRLRAKKPVSRAYPKDIKTIGDHVRKRRLDLGLTQKEAAETMGVDEATVWNWEGHRTEPHPGEIPAIVSFLGYEPFPPDGDSLSGKLRHYRILRGLSRKALAGEIGIDPATLARIENGNGRIFRAVRDKVTAFLDAHKVRPGSPGFSGP